MSKFQFLNKFQILNPKFKKFRILGIGVRGLFVICCLIFGILFSGSVHAQIFSDNLSGAPGSTFTTQTLFSILNGLACWAIRFAMITSSIALIFAGITYLTSRGNPQGMEKARKALTWGIIGTIVIFGVFTIILTVAYIVGVNYPVMNYINC